MRPLWFEYPNDIKTYLIEDQYLVGKDLLVAPVLRSGRTKRNVYFPVGDDWMDWYSGKIFKGGSSADVDAPIDRLPLFARVGSVIPTQPAVQNTDAMANAPITLTVISGIAENKTEESSLFQDNGDGYDYRLTKNWRDVKIEHKRGVITIKRHGYAGTFQPIKYVTAIGFPVPPKEVRTDGVVTSDFIYDSANKILKITLPNDEVKEITVTR